MSYFLIRPLLFLLPPETAHKVTLNALHQTRKAFWLKFLLPKIPPMPTTVMGLNFSNPVGLAAGMDKNAEYLPALNRLGFGFLEVGTVTPKPQLGNPKPRLFRLPRAHALINRMGFNNQGVDRLIHHIKQADYQGILGINIGKNAQTPLENAMDDYLMGFLKVYPYADYIAINISSPNTKGLRQLQQEQALAHLISSLKKAQTQYTQQYQKYVPLVIKIAPDLTDKELTQIAKLCLQQQVDGLIATNTTIERAGVVNLKRADESGGLSGQPLSQRATQVIWQLSQILQGEIPIIASGGVMSAQDAQDKLQAGASLIQIYTGLIYKGPILIQEIVESMIAVQQK